MPNVENDKIREDSKVAKVDISELTKEQIAKAMACETAEELMALAKAGGRRADEGRGRGLHG